MNTVCWFYCNYAAIVVLVLSGVKGQNISFFDYNTTIGGSRCTETLISKEDRIILIGQAYLPENSSIQKLIIFDLKTESKASSVQLCTVHTENDCRDTTATDTCYCVATGAANVYEFVVNITAESRLSYGRIKGYLLFGNSSQIATTVMLPLVQDSKVGVNADITINGKPAEEACNGTIQDEELKVTAQCQSPHYGCLLELSVGKAPKSAKVSSGSLSYEVKVQVPSNVTLRLRAASCSKENLSLLKECSISFTKDSDPNHKVEMGNMKIIIITVASSVGSVLLVILIITIILYRRRLTRQRTQQSGQEKLLKKNSIQSSKLANEDGVTVSDSHPLLVEVKKPNQDTGTNEDQDTCVIEEEDRPPPKPPRLNSIRSDSTPIESVEHNVDETEFTESQENTEKTRNEDDLNNSNENKTIGCQESLEEAQPKVVGNHSSQNEIIESQEQTAKV